MIWTGKMMAAVIPQIIIEPQPPKSSTDQPSDPRRNPGFARQITNPSYQRRVFRNWRSSTTASATLHLHVASVGRSGALGPQGPKVTAVARRFNRAESDVNHDASL